MMDGRYLPLIALGGGIMGGKLGRGLQGFAQATMQGQQFDREARQDEQRAKMLEMQTRAMEGEAEARRQQAAWTQQALAGMPEDQRALVLAGGPAALAKLAESRFGPRKPEDVTVGNITYKGIWNPETNSYDKVPGTEAPRWAPQQGPAPDNTLVEIGDPTSPTGTRFVPRAQAIGQPGKPGSNGLQITGYDEAGRPIISMGGSAQPKPPAGYRATPDGQGLEAIPGGPATKVGGDIAGKKGLLPGALEDIKSVRAALFDAKGDVNTLALGTANPPIPGVSSLPFTEGAGIRGKVMGAIDTMARIRTGAAAPESEMASLMEMYMPTVTDPVAVAKSKLDRLERDILNVEGSMSQGSGVTTSIGVGDLPSNAAKPGTVYGEPVKITSQAEYDALPSGASFVDEEGTRGVKP